MDSQIGARSKQPLAFNSLLVYWESSSLIYHPKFLKSTSLHPLFHPAASFFSPSTIQVTESTNLSSITDQYNAVAVIPERTLTDVNGVKHHQVVYPMGQQSSGKKCTKTRACKICKSNGQRHLVCFYYHTCGLSAAYCWSLLHALR